MSGCPGWESVNPVCRVGQVLGGAAKSVGGDVFDSIAHSFANVATSMTSWLWHQLDNATSIDLTTASLKSDLIATGAIAALVTFALFLIQVIASTLRQEPGGLVRAVRGLGTAFIGAAFAVAATQLLLSAVDGLCNAVVRFALGTDMSGMGTKLVAASALTNIVNAAGLLLISLVIIAAVVVVWVALMVRKMLIIVSAVFAPLAFSGAASDVSKSWVRRWIEFTVALIFSKLILVIIFMTGLSVLNGAGGSSSSHGGNHGTQTMTNLAIGTLTLLLAGFAPWLAIKMVHFAGDSFHVAHQQAGAAAAGGRTVVAAPQKMAAHVQRHRATFAGTAAGLGSRTEPSAQGRSGGAGSGTTGRTAGAVLAGAAAVPRVAAARIGGRAESPPPPQPASPPSGRPPAPARPSTETSGPTGRPHDR